MQIKNIEKHSLNTTEWKYFIYLNSLRGDLIIYNVIMFYENECMHVCSLRAPKPLNGR